jgi:hypothetical protein
MPLSRLANHKIRPDHLDRQALIYVRQSTLLPGRANTGSTARQYDLGPGPWTSAGPGNGFASSIRTRDNPARQPLPARACNGSSPKWGSSTLGPCSVWKHRASPARAATGITCWSAVP